MATARTQKAKAAEAAPAEEAAPKAAPKAAAQKQVVKVQNMHSRLFYVHPATGTRLGAGQIRELPRDSWIEMQLAAGILKEV